MRYLILSDIHANLEAFEAVLAAVPAGSYDRLIVLGDLVGYGADPNAVVDRVRVLKPDVVVRGNHDKVAAGIEEPEGFNSVARQAARWTFDTLTPENREYLANLTKGPLVIDDILEICHGSPLDEDLYIFENIDAIRALRAARRRVCFFGHTHLPIVFLLSEDAFDVVVPDAMSPTILPLRPDCKYLVNPGAIGQPRDGDPRAAYAILDEAKNEIWLYRVPYPVKDAQKKIAAAGLPEGLARRLAMGR